jgi:hypothetical protein
MRRVLALTLVALCTGCEPEPDRWVEAIRARWNELVAPPRVEPVHQDVARKKMTFMCGGPDLTADPAP